MKRCSPKFPGRRLASAWGACLLLGAASSAPAAAAEREEPVVNAPLHSAHAATRPAAAHDAPADEPDNARGYARRPRPLTPLSPPRPARELTRYPTLPWLLTQLVPSPSLWAGPSHRGADGVMQHGAQAHFGLAWQITPVLYSFGIHRRVSPWRFVLVDPLARVSGSVEWHVSPEWIAAGDKAFLLRTGVRTTLPLLHRGENLALLLGASYANLAGEHGVVFEAGVTVLYGALGLVFSSSPTHPDLRYGVRLNLRYF